MLRALFLFLLLTESFGESKLSKNTRSAVPHSASEFFFNIKHLYTLNYSHYFFSNKISNKTFSQFFLTLCGTTVYKISDALPTI